MAAGVKQTAYDSNTGDRFAIRDLATRAFGRVVVDMRSSPLECNAAVRAGSGKKRKRRRCC